MIALFVIFSFTRSYDFKTFKSIVDDAWPFWEALDKAGVYTIVGGHGSNALIVPGGVRGLR